MSASVVRNVFPIWLTNRIPYSRWLLWRIGLLQNAEDAASWSVEYVGHVLQSPLIGRTTLAQGLTYDRARQFAEAYVLSAPLDAKGLREPAAEWRKAPMSDKQRENLRRVGIEL